MLTLIPAAERPYFSMFGEDIQSEVARILPYLHKVDAAKSVAAALVEQAAAAGMAEGTFRRKYYAWKKSGCKGLVPGNKVPQHLVAKAPRQRIVRHDPQPYLVGHYEPWSARI